MRTAEAREHNFFCIHSDTQGIYSDTHACTATLSSAMLTAEARASAVRRSNVWGHMRGHGQSPCKRHAYECTTHIHAYRCIASTATMCLCRLGGGTRPRGVCTVSVHRLGRMHMRVSTHTMHTHTMVAAAVARSEGHDGTRLSRHRRSQHKGSARHDRRGRCAHQGTSGSSFFCFSPERHIRFNITRVSSLGCL